MPTSHQAMETWEMIISRLDCAMKQKNTTIIKKKISGEENANAASSYNNLGNDYQLLGQYNEAKQYFEKAVLIKQCSEVDECPKNAREIRKFWNQTRKTDSASLTSHKLARLENC